MQSCRYFGIELGVVEADYKFVTKFPYNVLPHPMILGQVVALFGVHVAPQVSRARPLLVPIHIALCVCGADVSPMNRGDAAAATWIFRGDDAAAATRTVETRARPQVPDAHAPGAVRLPRRRALVQEGQVRVRGGTRGLVATRVSSGRVALPLE